MALKTLLSKLKKQPVTVASLTADLAGKARQLYDLSAAKSAEVAANNKAIEALKAASDAANAEGYKAAQVASKIEALIS
jgi:hypothetical protein